MGIMAAVVAAIALGGPGITLMQHLTLQGGCALAREARRRGWVDTYVELIIANIFSLFQCNENKGCEGDILLLVLPEATLEWEAGNKDRVTSMSPHADQSPCRVSMSRHG